jgi:hypothetical protein
VGPSSIVAELQPARLTPFDRPLQQRRASGDPLSKLAIRHRREIRHHATKVYA